MKDRGFEKPTPPSSTIRRRRQFYKVLTQVQHTHINFVDRRKLIQTTKDKLTFQHRLAYPTNIVKGCVFFAVQRKFLQMVYYNN